MKNLLGLILLTVVSVICYGQGNYQDVVYLKNGSIIHGVIIEEVPNVSIKIETACGNVFAYKLSEVEKLTKEEIQKKYLSPDKNTQFSLYTGFGINMQPFIKGSLGFDFLSSVSDRFAIGGFLGYQTVASVSVGTNMLIGDYKKKQAFFVGTGANFNANRGFFLTRYGIRSFKSRFYTFFELGLGNGGGGAIMSVNLGINLN